MPNFEHDGLTLAYDDIAPNGAARTIVLVHGFASNRNEAWRRTGWYGAFERRGVRCVALDQRGHGDSAKPHDPAAYGRASLASDVVALLDHLDLRQVDLFGYSMGARVALETALRAPDRIDHLILGGVGARLLDERPETGAMRPMADAMLADDAETISHPFLRSFRQFADEQGEDRQALAACSQAVSPRFDPADLAGFRRPTLVVAGVRDEGAADPEGLAGAFADGRAVTLPGCDHFSAIPHALTKAAVFDFLDGLLDEI